MYPSEYITTTSSLFHFPNSPYLHYQDDPVFLQNLNDILFTTSTDINNISTQNNNMAADSTTSTTPDDQQVQTQGNNTNQQSLIKREPKKRTSKKDRHSKIETVHGPRDRRMRLSLDVARKFFGLQDLLGFEKASKTVAWLLSQSESAIKDLSRSAVDINSSSYNLGVVNSASSTSECEVLSGIQEPARVVLAKLKLVKAASPEKKRKGANIVRRAAFDSTARELREKARERARERTQRKRYLQVEDKLNLSRLRSLSPPKNGYFVEAENRSSNDDTNVIDDDHEEGINTTDDIFGDSFWSSSTFFNYHHNSTSHEISEFQVYAKPWEGYNNCI